MEPLSHSKYIENTSAQVMRAFRHFGVGANQVLAYDDLFPYLEAHDPKFRDTMREVENHLNKEGFITPDISGLRLTEVGFRNMQ